MDQIANNLFSYDSFEKAKAFGENIIKEAKILSLFHAMQKINTIGHLYGVTRGVFNGGNVEFKNTFRVLADSAFSWALVLIVIKGAEFFQRNCYEAWITLNQECENIQSLIKEIELKVEQLRNPEVLRANREKAAKLKESLEKILKIRLLASAQSLTSDLFDRVFLGYFAPSYGKFSDFEQYVQTEITKAEFEGLQEEAYFYSSEVPALLTETTQNRGQETIQEEPPQGRQQADLTSIQSSKQTLGSSVEKEPLTGCSSEGADAVN